MSGAVVALKPLIDLATGGALAKFKAENRGEGTFLDTKETAIDSAGRQCCISTSLTQLRERKEEAKDQKVRATALRER